MATALARYFSKLGFDKGTSKLGDGKDKVYAKLKEDEIRLITLQPGQQGSIVECNIEIASIGLKSTVQCAAASNGLESMVWYGPYDALSYAWGDPQHTREIRVSNIPFKATVNLELALRNLRHERSVRKLWVDAICIDQEDDTERNAQIKQMAKIYGRASRVLIWLGQIDSKSELAFDMVERSIRPSVDDFISLNRTDFPYAPRKGHIKDIIAKFNEDSNKDSHESLIPKRRKRAIELGYQLYDFNKDERTLNEAIIHTFTPRGGYHWWRRLWVLQEVIYSCKAFFVRGSRLVSLHDIPRVLRGYSYHTTSKKTCSALLSSLDHVLKLEELRIQFVGHTWNHQPTKSLEHLIKAFSRKRVF
jgi:hypothetical protein